MGVTLSHKLTDTAARAAAAALLAFALTCALGRSLFLPIDSYWAVAAHCAIVAAAAFACMYSPRTFIAGGGLLLVACLVAYWALDEAVIGRWRAQLEWAARYGANEMPYDFELAAGLIYPLATVMTVLCALLARYRHTFILSAALALGSLCAEWSLDHRDILPFVWPALAALGVQFALSAYSERGTGAVRVSALALALMLAVTGVAAVSVPEKTLPSERFGRFMDDVGDLFGDYVLFTRPRYAFSIRRAGLMPLDSRLGGPIVDDDTEVLSVAASTPQLLRATTRNYYNGRMWMDSLDQRRMLFGSPFSSDDRNTVFQLNLPGGDGRAEFMETGIYTITHLEDGVSTLFAPTRPLSTEGGGLRVYFNNSGELFHTRNVLKDTHYTVTSLIPNTSREGFADYLHTVAQGNDPYYETVRLNYLQIHDAVDPEVLLLADVLTGAQRPDADYAVTAWGPDNTIISYASDESASEPNADGVAIDIEELGLYQPIEAQELMRMEKWLDRKSLYDAAVAAAVPPDASPYETALAIKAFLTSYLFTYTKTPEAPPEDRDFVSYFLLEDREGYCTYYASAMTILARACGIPARYVEGYKLPETKRDGEYIVRGDSAHAWTEIYLKGYGWMAIDATRPAEVTVVSSGTGSGIVDDPVPTPPPYDQGLEEDVTPWLGMTDDTRDYTLAASIAAGALALALLIVLSVRRYYRAHPRKQKEPDRARAALNYYVDILYLLRCFGNCVLSGETPYDFAEKVDRWFKEEPCTMRYVADVVVRMRYAGAAPTLREVDDIDAFHHILEKRARKYVGGLRFIWYRMFDIPRLSHPAELPTGPVKKSA